MELGLGLAEVDLGGDAALETVLGELQVLAPRLEGPPGNLEPPVEVAQLEVNPRDVRDQGEHHGAPGLLRAEEQRLLGLARAADAAEEIELPGDVGGAVQ